MKPRQIEVEITADTSQLEAALLRQEARTARWAARVQIRQLMAAIKREIDCDPPFSAANAERRGELDQLRDMIERRT